jgi:CheY-like chemotaxis protein
MKILILEDDTRRRRAMADCLSDRFWQYELVFFSNAADAKAYLQDHLDQVLLLSLDHDLELLPDGKGRFIDPGTGRDVVDFLMDTTPSFPVVLHSTNYAAVLGMRDVLDNVGWNAIVVAPYDDLAWIHEAWFPAVRRAIVDAAQPVPGPELRAND